jgi:mono/diheme cytochrome c family protein
MPPSHWKGSGHPPLDGSDKKTNELKVFVLSIRSKGAIVVNGKNNSMMPAMVSDEEVADVMNYIMNLV